MTEHDARQAMERAVERLPSEYLENYVDNYERGNVGRKRRRDGRALSLAACCAIGCMTAPPETVDEGGRYEPAKRGPDGAPLTKVEDYYEGEDSVFVNTPGKRARAADIYASAVLELTRRKGLRTLPPARTEPAEVAHA